MDKKREILEIALIEFANHGYENTSLEDIAKKCNITKAAIYYHFKNKKELYSQIFIEKFKDFNLKLSNDLIKDMQSYIDEIYKILNSDFAKLFSKELSNEMKNLNEEAIFTISKTLRILHKIIKNRQNPFFIQTLIISSFTTYYNTLNIRKKIVAIYNEEDMISDFDIKENIKKVIINLLKANNEKD